MWNKCLCPDGKEVSFEDCLKCNDECFDIEIREAIFNQEERSREERGGLGITASMITGCPREVYLKRKHEYSVNPKKMWWSLRGQLIHKILETDNRPDGSLKAMSEERLSWDCDGIEISGKLDRYVLRFAQGGLLKDWKTIGDNGMQYIIYKGAKEEHVWQSNIYARILIANNYPVNKIEIAYMSMMDVIKTGKPAEFMEYLKNPPKAVKSGEKDRRRMIGDPEFIKEYYGGRKKFKCTYLVPEVPIMDERSVIGYVKPKAEAILKGFEFDVEPPPCDEDMRAWKCAGYCDVKQFCAYGG